MVPPTALALVAMGFSTSLAEITLWRGVIAIFYAAATIACQGYANRAAVLGFRNTYLLGITLNVVIGVSAIALSRRDSAVTGAATAVLPSKKTPPRFKSVPEPTRTDLRLAAAIALLSGFMTLGF